MRKFSLESLKDKGFTGVSGLMAALSFVFATGAGLLVVLGLLTVVPAIFIRVFDADCCRSGIVWGALTGQAHFVMPLSTATVWPHISKLTGLVFILVQGGIMVYGAWQAGCCFLQLAQQKYFAPKTITTLRNFSISGLVYVVMSVALPVIFSTIDAVPISFQHAKVPPYMWGFRLFGDPTLSAMTVLAIYAFTLTMIAAIMAKAAVIAEDNAQII